MTIGMKMIRNAVLAATLAVTSMAAFAQSEVLASVGKFQVTAADLEQAINSSPIASQFPSMDREQQAALRGDMLKRLVASKLLLTEALHRGLDKTQSFRNELKNYRQTLLYRAYWANVRAGIKVPAAKMAEFKKDYASDMNALTAAKSDYIAQHYKLEKLLKLQELKERFHFKTIKKNIKAIAAGKRADTLLAKADGFEVHLADIADALGGAKHPTEAKIEAALFDRANLLLSVAGAKAQGEKTADQLAGYRDERLAEILVEQMTAKWIPDEKTAQAFFAKHQSLGHIPASRHVAQIVVKDRAKAQQLRARILKGESFYALAEKESIDPYGRKHAGDMGWVKEGLGAPSLEKVLAALPENKVSEVVQSPHGFHLLMVLGRKKGQQLSYAEVKDRVRQAMISEHMANFLHDLEQRYQIAWNVSAPAQKKK